MNLPSVPQPLLPVVLFLLGGGRAVLSSLVWLWRPVYVVIADVASELPDPAPIRRHCPNVRLFSLGDGHTSDSLVAECSPGTRAIVRGHAGTAAVNGLGQARFMGHVATEELLQSEDYALFLQDLEDQLKIATHGVVPGALWVCQRSAGGATGSGAVAIPEDSAIHISSVLGIPVHIHDNVVGPITFAGLGNRLLPNAAFGLAERCDDLVAKRGSLLVTRDLTVTDYPPSGRDRTTRDAILALDEQLAASGEYLRSLSREAPNDSFKGPLGAVQLRQIATFESLPFGFVATEIAESIGGQIDAILARDKADRSRPITIDYHGDHIPAARQSTDHILSAVEQVPLGQISDALTEPEGQLTYHAIAEFDTGDEVLLAQAETYYATPPESPQAAERRLKQQSTCIKCIEDEAVQLDECLQAEEQRLIEARSLLQKKHGSLISSLPSFWSLESKQKQFDAAARELRAASDARRHTEAKLDALVIALNAVSAEREHLRSHLVRITEVLDSHVPRGIRETSERHTAAKSLDELWPDLWRLDCLPKAEQQGVIAAAVSTVTAAGLAHVVAARTPRLDAIAQEIAFAEYPIEGPPWAGRPSDTGRTILALPPMLPDDREKLSGMLKKAMPSADIVFTDTAAAGINVMRCQLSGISNLGELIAGDLRHHFNSLLRTSQHTLFTTRDPAAFARIGVEQRNGDIIFNELGVSNTTTEEQ